MNTRWRTLRSIGLTIAVSAVGGGIAIVTGFVIGLTIQDESGAIRARIPMSRLMSSSTPIDELKDTSYMQRLTTGQVQVQEAGWACSDALRPLLLRPRIAGTVLRGQDWSCTIVKKGNFAGAALHQINMQGAILRRSNFANSTLTEVDAAGTTMPRATFTHSTLTDVTFSGAMLRRSNWVGAALQRVDFVGADLRGADFCGVTGLQPTDLDGTRMNGMRCPNGTVIPRLSFGDAQSCNEEDTPLPVAECRGAYDTESN